MKAPVIENCLKPKTILWYIRQTNWIHKFIQIWAGTLDFSEKAEINQLISKTNFSAQELK